MESLTPQIIFGVIAGYFLVLMVISYFTGRGANNSDFFLANRKSPWYLVAFGMIGASLSGVTFVSIPGAVGASHTFINDQGVSDYNGNVAFSYMQMVFGYLVGYAVIALVLLPLYYKNNLTSIYGYLGKRFGNNSYKIGAFYFLLSRTVGASFRLFLVAFIFQSIFDIFDIDFPFWGTVAVTILLIWFYTFQGGIKTIVWTDTLQTFFMLLAVVLTISAIGNALGKNWSELATMVQESEYGKMFFFDDFVSDPNNFYKQFLSGALIAIVMTGLDQDMMQKNLSCRSLGESQKNMFAFSFVLIFVNILFLGLGALLYLYAANVGIEVAGSTDLVFAELVLNNSEISPWVGIVFILGLIAAAYSSADSALTSLTTSFCVDFLGMEKNEKTEEENKRTRLFVHIGFSILLFIIIVLTEVLNGKAVINQIFTFAGYTYGPLLGLFTFGIFSSYKIRDEYVIIVCILAPVLTYILNTNNLFMGFRLGSLNIALNGILTFLGLLAISYYEQEESDEIAVED